MGKEGITVIDSKDVINIVRNTLKLVDQRLIDHGTRVAYLLYHMLKNNGEYNEKEISDSCILGVFHDIGAYKTEEIDKLLLFEAGSFLEHSIYGYLFIKLLTPLKAMSEVVLYHHFDYIDLQKMNTSHKEITLMLHLADRVDALMQLNGGDVDWNYLEGVSGTCFDPKHIELLKRSEEEISVITKIQANQYEDEVQTLLSKLHFSDHEIDQYLKMLVYSIDFRSDVTVSHTVNTIYISMEIAKLLHLNLEDRSKIYYGALLHDLGKIAIPIDILESPRKLNGEQMAVMKTHVNITEEIISGIIDDEICQLAIRHHEKLDGTGYPKGLTAKDLTNSQGIIAVADILSALGSERSYKKSFPMERTKRILKEQRDTGKLNPQIVTLVLEHYNSIMARADEASRNTLQIYFNIKKEYSKLHKKLKTNYEPFYDLHKVRSYQK